jgi:hypothetical protein
MAEEGCKVAHHLFAYICLPWRLRTSVPVLACRSLRHAIVVLTGIACTTQMCGQARPALQTAWRRCLHAAD